MEILNLKNDNQILLDVLNNNVNSFIELPYSEKIEILKKANQTYGINKIITFKGFDILKKLFFVFEYKILDENLNYDKIEFVYFDEFYKYVNGNIYENTCFFGYTFSNKEINSYKINLNKINFSSFTKDTIDNYSFDSVMNQKKDSYLDVNKFNNDLIQLICECDKIKLFKKLIRKINEFVDNNTDYSFKHNVFFSTILAKKGDSIKEDVIDYFCSNPSDDIIRFEDILFTYGKESAIKAIENYNKTNYYAKSTKLKKVGEFKRILSKYNDNNKYVDFSSFKEKTQIYLVSRNYIQEDCTSYAIQSFYFFNFNDLIKFVKGDLSCCDFSQLLVDNINFKNYKLGKYSKLPIDIKPIKYEIIKKYENDKFQIILRWFNKDNVLIIDKNIKFDFFFDFLYFLKNDLSNSDLLNCEGIENIKNISNINFNEIKVSSDIANKLGIETKKIDDKFLPSNFFENITKNELISFNTYIEKRDNIFKKENEFNISYVSDIHLEHRIQKNECKNNGDVQALLKRIVDNIINQDSDLTLICGDTANTVELFNMFVCFLKERVNKNVFITLGNHELWDLDELKINDIISIYKSIINSDKIKLVHNNLFYYDEFSSFKEITEYELQNMSIDKLIETTKNAELIIFGGIGFAGKNNDFNANSLIYKFAINREEEINESEKFYNLYKKVKSALFDKNVIIMTHMPFTDWSNDEEYVNKFVYVSGHNHRNFYYDDGIKRIYADNQIGYITKNVGIKNFFINSCYDWLSRYEDGVYEISKNDYIKFNSGKNIQLDFNRDLGSITMLKKHSYYMFFALVNNRLYLLDGGKIRKTNGHDIKYFYENMDKYIESINNNFLNFYNYEELVSNEIKRIGGSGKIHGCIVDIDFSDHIYVNPLDKSLTPYFAESIDSKHVYKNISSLLEYNCPEIFEKYKAILNDKNQTNNLIIYNNKNSNETIFVSSTEIYKNSNIMKTIQYLIVNNIIRIWSDDLISKRNNKLTLKNLNSFDNYDEEVENIKIESKYISKTPIVNQQNTKDTYINKISKITSNIEIIDYINSSKPVEYRCKICGNIWKERPDHFKDRHKYKCPKCDK